MSPPPSAYILDYSPQTCLHRRILSPHHLRADLAVSPRSGWARVLVLRGDAIGLDLAAEAGVDVNSKTTGCAWEYPEHDEIGHVRICRAAPSSKIIVEMVTFGGASPR
ncbi:hypothetical protein G7046_g8847 [Stylonectria norvegica]|nr:hypothetical protein G7046_g8847 [Stylonectria norvegica]